MKIRLTRTKLAMALLFLGFVLIVRYAMRDLELDLDILREGLINMPGMVMENMRLKREISGDIWSFSIPYVERRDSRISVRSFDVRREIGTGGEWYFHGREGIYSEDERAAVLTHMVGTLNFGPKANGRVMNLESPRVSWSASSGEIVFSEGLSLYDSEFLIVAATASMDHEGVILFDNGGSIQWTKPIEWDSSLYPEDLDAVLYLDY